MRLLLSTFGKLKNLQRQGYLARFYQCDLKDSSKFLQRLLLIWTNGDKHNFQLSCRFHFFNKHSWSFKNNPSDKGIRYYVVYCKRLFCFFLSWHRQQFQETQYSFSVWATCNKTEVPKHHKPNGRNDEIALSYSKIVEAYFKIVFLLLMIQKFLVTQYCNSKNVP